MLSHNALPILFADDTSIIFTGNNELTFQEELNATFAVITNWFQLNALFLNFDKTQFVQFTSNNLNNYDTHVFYEDNYIAKVNDIKFLGININNTLTWTTHTETILPKLSSACFALRSVKPFVYEDLRNNLLCIFSLN